MAIEFGVDGKEMVKRDGKGGSGRAPPPVPHVLPVVCYLLLNGINILGTILPFSLCKQHLKLF